MDGKEALILCLTIALLFAIMFAFANNSGAGKYELCHELLLKK